MLQSERKDGAGGGARSCAYLPTLSKMTSGSDILWKKNNSWCWSMFFSVFLLQGTLKHPIYLKDEPLSPSL